MNAQPGFTASNLLVSIAAFIIIVAGMKAAASLLVPFLYSTMIAPSFSTTLPRESLGVPREGVITSC